MTSAERVAAKAAAKAKKRKDWRESRAFKKSVDPKFVQKVQASHDRYNEFTRLARQFARHFPEQFQHFKTAIAQGKGIPVASALSGPRHTLPTAVQRVPTGRLSLPTTPPIVPARNEYGRPKPPAVDLITLLGLARD
jgi:hypothetical protein